MNVGVLNADAFIEKNAEDIVESLYRKKDKILLKLTKLQKAIEQPKFLSSEENSAATLDE